MKLTGVGHTSIIDKNIDSSFSINNRFYHLIHLVLFRNVKYEFMNCWLVKFRHGFETSGSSVDDASMIGVCLASGIVSRYQLLSKKDDYHLQRISYTAFRTSSDQYNFRV